MIDAVKQIKIFSNISLITLEDYINEWLLNFHGIISVTKITEVRICEQPTFLIEYLIPQDRIQKNVIPFTMSTKIKEIKKGAK